MPDWFSPYADALRESKDINHFLSKIGSVSPDDTRIKQGGAKVLIFDIETAPLKGYVWSMWKQNISQEAMLGRWFVLTWSAKWLFDDKVFADKLTPDEVAREDDSRIIKSIWDKLEEADIVIAHNGDRFDLPHLNTRFLMNGLPCPSPYQSIDTLKHCRRRLKFETNRLDYIAQRLGVGRKMDTGGMKLWVDCMNGDPDALAKMERYNIVDVQILEEVYLAIRAWIKPHPNMYLFIGDNVARCPTCGSDKLVYVGEYLTYCNAYDAFRCENCGSTGRSRNTNTKLADHRQMKTSTPK